MSIVAEELGSLHYEAKCPPPQCRTSPSQLFPDSSQGFIQGFLYDSYEYALDPDTASVTLHNDGQNGFSWRGGDWLLVHWLYDQKGPAILQALEQTTAIGIPSIEATAGESFGSIFADYGLTLYTDSLPGEPRSAIPTRDRLVTRNLRQMFDRLYVTSQPEADIPLSYPVPVDSLGALSVAGQMDPGTSAYYVLTTSGSASTVLVQFASSTGTALSAAYKPQLAIYRLH
jgi:hypothetical protein